MALDSYNTLVMKVLSGEASSEEVQELNRQLEQSKELQNEFDTLQNIWEGTQIKQEFSNQDLVYRKIRHNILAQEKSTLLNSQKKDRWTRLRWVAAAAILIMFSIIFVVHEGILDEEQYAQENAQWIEKQNPTGQKSRIYLPDGSEVWLNAESSIRYLSDFNDSSRTIDLKGQAYFEVVKDSLRPFVVHTELADISVLGTKFDVKAYEGERTAKISLLEGKVAVQKNQSKEYLQPGQMAVASKSTEDQNYEFRVLPANVEDIVAWKDGLLIIDGLEFYDIVANLQRWYGVNIDVIGNPDKAMKFNGRFSNEYLDNVLESMRYGRDFDYEINGKNVVIKFDTKMKNL